MISSYSAGRIESTGTVDSEARGSTFVWSGPIEGKTDRRKASARRLHPFFPKEVAVYFGSLSDPRLSMIRVKLDVTPLFQHFQKGRLPVRSDRKEGN